MAVSESDLKVQVLKKLKDFFNFDFNDIIDNIDNNQIYLNKENILSSGIREKDVIIELVRILKSFDFISEVYSSDYILNSTKLEGYEELIQNGFHEKRSGDIAIVLKPNVIFYDGKGTTHGSGYNYDTHVPLIFFGCGIRNGETSKNTEIPDIAPTISDLLGFEMKNSTGKILDFIFE